MSLAELGTFPEFLETFPEKPRKLTRMQVSLRTLRIIHGFMLIALFVYASIPEWIGAHSDHKPSAITFYSITVVAICIVATIFIVRRRLIHPAEKLLANATMPNPAADLRWRKGYVMCFACCEAIGLYGLVLRFMGFGLDQVWPFYFAGIALMLYLRPRLLLPTEII